VIVNKTVVLYAFKHKKTTIRFNLFFKDAIRHVHAHHFAVFHKQITSLIVGMTCIRSYKTNKMMKEYKKKNIEV
jgi:hypothetical protein